MKFLVLTAAFPIPPDGGSKLRNLSIIERLARIGDVCLISLCAEAPERKHLEQMQDLCHLVFPVIHRRGLRRKIADCLSSTFGGKPYLVLANTNEEAVALAESLLHEESIDVIHIEELCMAGNVPKMLGYSAVVLDAHNAEALVQRRIAELPAGIFQRMFNAYQARLTRKYEAKVASRVDAVLGVTRDECEYFRQLNKRTALVPNGVAQVSLGSAERSSVMIFTGTLQYPPNQDALRWLLTDIWPRISAKLPEASLEIIARKPPRHLEELAGERVMFRPFIDEIEPHLRTARLMLVPLRAGGGSRMKILQAFTHGLPVVSTHIGADGLNVSDGVELCLRDDAEEFAKAAIELFRDTERQRLLANNAAQLIEREYLWDDIFLRCVNAYEQIVR